MTCVSRSALNLNFVCRLCERRPFQAARAIAIPAFKFSYINSIIDHRTFILLNEYLIFSWTNFYPFFSQIVSENCVLIVGCLCVCLTKQIGRNVCHGSDSSGAAKDEISLWFAENEVFSWSRSQDDWVFEK